MVPAFPAAAAESLIAPPIAVELGGPKHKHTAHTCLAFCFSILHQLAGLYWARGVGQLGFPDKNSDAHAFDMDPTGDQESWDDEDMQDRDGLSDPLRSFYNSSRF